MAPVTVTAMLRRAGLLALLLAVAPLGAQTFPAKPVRIVTAEAGGGADFITRVVAQGLGAALGQQFVVENRGGSVILPVEAVSRAPADGHVLLLYSNAVWTLPLLQSVPYDAARDLAPLSLIATSPNLVVVHPSLPVRTLQDLIALARARPGELNYSTGTPGSAGHLAAELFKAMTGLQITRISYKGAGPALNALIGGEVALHFSTAASGSVHVKSGRLRALAVTSAQPSVLVPDLPTAAAAGVPGYESVGSYGLFAPAKTPDAVMARLSQEIVRLLARTETRERMLNAGAEAVGNAPAAFAAQIAAETARVGQVIRDGRMRIE
jgi:tripartite-type tricarboxylate transporter receptor subunit TctC